ncbi:MAG: hypothetical protein JO038_08560 [Alphaproteobacteria bacterium]|nr:hypothetical protein [Alphaproteobacteria bacterium]
MTKGPGQKHFQHSDPEHAAHQNETVRHQDHDAMRKSPTGNRPAGEVAGHPAEQAPKAPHKGQ